MANVRIPKPLYSCEASRLVEGVGAGSPVGEEQGETDGLEGAGKSTDGDSVHGALLGEHLGDDLVNISVYSKYGLEAFAGWPRDDLRKEQRKRRRSMSRGKRHPCR
jgi:hypothetical protein